MDSVLHLLICNKSAHVYLMEIVIYPYKSFLISPKLRLAAKASSELTTLQFTSD